LSISIFPDENNLFVIIGPEIDTTHANKERRNMGMYGFLDILIIRMKVEGLRMK
jgi:hypothetical protein